MKSPQCEIHDKEITKVSERSHANTNEIQKLYIMHKENCKDINAIKGDVNKINSAQSNMEKDISEMKTNIKWLKEKYESLDKKFWAILLLVITTLVSTIINHFG